MNSIFGPVPFRRLATLTDRVSGKYVLRISRQVIFGAAVVSTSLAGAAGPDTPAAGAALRPAESALQAEPASRQEPEVKHTVTEDKGSRIEELRVRGQVQQIIVTPKVGTHIPYEIAVGRGGDDPLSGGMAGKRVWQLLSF